MANSLDEEDWEILIDSIRDNNCTPFIGAGANAGILPVGSEIARQWAKEYKYPLNDTDDLARVSQFLAVKRYDMFPKDRIKNQFKEVSPPDFTDPNEPHALLADLNLPVYITTNYDSFMYLALKDRKHDPKRELCRWNGFVQQNMKSVFGDDKNGTDYTPTSANPLVYHLHGHYDIPQSLVLTEDDYLDFLAQISSNHSLLPPAIRTALSCTALLFIGYSLSDWNFRVLFRGLVGSLGASLGYQSVAVQLAPQSIDDSEKGRESAINYLNVYFEKIQKIRMRVYWGDIKEFTSELRQRWDKAKDDNK